jgi:hypothetical protein
MGCKKQKEVRNSNEVKIVCTNRSCINFSKEVPREHCDNVCPLVVTDIRLHRSVERKPDMRIPEPVFQGELLLCDYTPQGFKELEPGQQLCLYPKCDSLTKQASLNKDGSLKFHFYCAGKPTTLKDCERCQAGDSPGYLKQLRNYAHATTAWVKNDMPSRSDAEVMDILNNKCMPCEHYEKSKGRCRVGGCRLNLSATAVANKIRMATEHCPKGKW